MALLQKGQPWTLNWTEPTFHAFHDIKNALSTELVLHAAQPGYPFILFTDASGYGIGMILSQEIPQGKWPVQCLS